MTSMASASVTIKVLGSGTRNYTRQEPPTIASGSVFNIKNILSYSAAYTNNSHGKEMANADNPKAKY